MFTKIAKIKNIGSFKDFNNNISLGKNNIFYALNGHGKTTLTSIIYSIKNNDFSSIEGRKTLGEIGNQECNFYRGSLCYRIDGKKWKIGATDLDKNDNNIIIFDDNYINENIFSEKFEINHKKSLHRIIFGDDGVKLNNELNTLQGENKKKKAELVALEGKFNDTSPYSLLNYTKIDISRLDKEELKESRKKVINDIKNIGEQSQISLKDNLLELPTFDYILGDIENVFSILKVNGKAHEKAKTKVEEFKKEYFIDVSNTDSFIKYGLKNIKKDKCSFCHQSLTEEGDLLEVYKDFFDEEYDDLLKKLNRYCQTYKDYNFELDIKNLTNSYKENKGLYDYWGEKIKLIDLSSLKDLGNLIKSIRDIHADVITDLEKKLKDLNSDFDTKNINALITLINDSNILIKGYNVTIKKNIILIDNFKKSLDSSKLVSLSKEKRNIELKLLRLDSKEIEKIEKYNLQLKAIDISSGLINSKRKELNDYTKTIISDYETLINSKLKDLGINHFKVGHIEDTTHVLGSYVEIIIEINGKKINLKDYEDRKPSFKNTLSKGDKNSLAFAFFLAFIENNSNKSDLILVFDDPLSSHDENRQRQTVNQIRLLSSDVKQTIVLTHKREFLTLLNKLFKSDSNYFHLKKSRALCNSSISNLDIGKFLSSEFEKTVERLEEYLIDTTSFPIGSIQNELRKVFEDVFKLKYYRLLRKEKRTIFTYNTLNDNFFSKGKLGNIKTELIELASYVNDGSHFTSVSGNEEELCGYIEQSLKLIEKI